MLRLATYPQRLLRVILPRHNQHLKAFPPKWRHLLNHLIHILLEIIPAHHSIDLELDSIFLTQLTKLHESLEMLASSATDFDVGGFVEGIAGDGHDVEVRGVLFEPGFCDFTAVCDDGDGFHA